MMHKLTEAESGSIPDRRSIFKNSPENTSVSESSLHWITPRDKNLIRDLRHVMRENQTQFWRRFGVTQTQGSRFERGRPVPLAVLLLIRLYLLQVIDDRDLQQVGSANFDLEGLAG